ncbi:MAG: 50S ribosomal protein L11 methyltransferase [Clostridia bacterium]|nr:50S ribosomal protein L11 methyltransferase [Clostridia bacterium]
MKYIELTVHTTTEASELIADVMWEYTPHGVAVCDAADIVALQRDSTVYWDYMDDSLSSPQRTDVLVKCFLEPDTAEETASRIMREIAARRELSGGAIPFGTLEETKREIDGDDWIDVWKKHFRPLHIGERVVVVPEWIAYQPQPCEATVLLDSNMAFGTGEHETTSMCLELLQTYLKAGDTCIDVGCGSGILGIAAAKLGASRCYLTDIDPIAVESATHNAQKNGVSDRVAAAHSNLLDDANITGELVLANITAEVLVMLAPAIPNYLKKNGTLILSGIIADRLEKVRAAFVREGLKELEARQKGEWYALALRRD